MKNSDCVVIIPTYNEKENVENIVRAVLALEHGFHILIIDDGSPDGTAEIVKRLQKEEFPDELHLVERTGKLGLGTAYIAGFKWAIEHGYDFIFEMDADFSHDPKDLPRLYDACSKEGFDLAIGSRYVSKVLETIDLDAIRFKGYAFQIEMKFTAFKLGFKIKEVPVIFVNRVLGTSKMSGGIFGEALFGVIRLRWAALTGKIKPRKL